MTPIIDDTAKNIKLKAIGSSIVVLNYWLNKNSTLYIHAIEYIQGFGFVIYYKGTEKINT